jgi:hypothetical protein
MRILTNVTVAAVCTVLVAGCGGGGGGDAGKSVYDHTVSGTPTDPVAVPASLILTLDQTSVKNSDSTPVSAKVIAVDSSGKALPDVAITFSVVGAQYTTGATSVTGADGSLTASVIYSNDKSNRVVDVTATAVGASGNIVATRSFVVSGVKITSTATPAILTPGSAGSIEFALADANASPIAGASIVLNSSLGSVTATATTGGKYIYNYTLPNSYASSDFVVTASSMGATQTQTVGVQLGSSVVVIDPATATPSISNVEVDPAVVGTNPVGSPVTQSATVRFKAYDAASLPLKNVRVSFDLDGDVNGIGGTFSSGSSLVYTDSNGIATSTYTPGATASATNGLTIRACFNATDFTPSSTGTAVAGSAACPNKQTQKITINNEALNITIGSDDKIAETPDGLRYVVKYAVQVVNASGQAKAGVTITPTLDMLGFDKGHYFYDDPTSLWVQVVRATGSYADVDVPSITYTGCRNEDVNRNGNRDTGEDLDGDTVLEPRKSDAAISFVDPSQLTTDSTGSVALQVTYLKNVASWARIKIYVKGAVKGTEGTGTFETVLPVPTTTLTSKSTPAFATNPYGDAGSCSSH